jgi:predicted metal-binding protein
LITSPIICQQNKAEKEKLHKRSPMAPCCLVNHCHVLCRRFIVLHKAAIHKVKCPEATSCLTMLQPNHAAAFYGPWCCQLLLRFSVLLLPVAFPISCHQTETEKEKHSPVAARCLVNHCRVVCCRFIMLHKAAIHKVKLPRGHQLPHLVLHAGRLKVPPASKEALTAAAAARAAAAAAAAV